jgi:hypothetical protein
MLYFCAQIKDQLQIVESANGLFYFKTETELPLPQTTMSYFYFIHTVCTAQTKYRHVNLRSI